MESYRPVNNLCCLEKLAEAHILKYLEIFFEKNDIFEKNHHGGRKNFSTVSAISQIHDTLYKN